MQDIALHIHHWTYKPAKKQQRNNGANPHCRANVPNIWKPFFTTAAEYTLHQCMELALG